MQLFDTGDSASDTVAALAIGGLLAGDGVLLVLEEERRLAVERRLLAARLPLRDAIVRCQLVALDAGELLAELRSHDRLDLALARESVARLLARPSSRSGRLRVYGEVIDRLVAEGDYADALALERCWSAALGRMPVTLLCGYAAEHFGDPRLAGTLDAICAAHTSIRSNPRDALATFLVSGAVAGS